VHAQAGAATRGELDHADQEGAEPSAVASSPLARRLGEDAEGRREDAYLHRESETSQNA
jgi:hypothetical protein